MDEVPVANANPVNTIINKPEKVKKPEKSGQIVTSLKNLVFMAPLAAIILIQLFFFGKSFGTFTTLPYTSFSTFILLATLVVFLFFTQMLLRSIVYSTLAGVCLVSGIFYAWFGDFHTPIFENIQGIGSILKAAWSRKDIPFPLFVSGIMTFSILGIAFIQFFISLFVKSFFETFFGKDWGDGKWMGFAGAIALIAGMQLGFHFYSSMSSNSENKFQWELSQKYKPIEKYLTQTPGSVMVSEDKIWSSHNGKIRAISLETGKILEERPFKSTVIRPGFQKTHTPDFFDQKQILAFNHEMNAKLWKASFPASFTGLVVSEDKSDSVDFIPQTAFYVTAGKNLLVFYNYGYVGLYEKATGKELWLKSVDRKVAVKRHFSSNFPEKEFFFETSDRIIFSCQNGIVKALNKLTGEELWSYSHTNPKNNGKPQRAFLTGQSDRVLAAFKTGEMITLALENGRVTYQAKNDAFSFNSAPAVKGIEASFLTDEGFFYVAEVDGGRILYSCNLLPKKLDFLPIVRDLNQGIVAHKDKVIKIANNEAKSVLRTNNRIFATNPVFDDKIMYIGTQDGWIYCVHTGSMHEKWKIHVNGELEQDSLTIAGTRLLVLTRSGSIMSIDRRL